MFYNPKTKQVIIRRSYQTLHDNDQPIPDPINQSNHLLPAPVTIPDPVSLSPTIVSGNTSKSKNYAALPGQPYLFTTIQSEPDNATPLRSSRIGNSQTISPTIIQSYVKDNKGRRRSLRHANISNRFTCLSSDDDDDSSIQNNPSDVFSTFYFLQIRTRTLFIILMQLLMIIRISKIYPTCHQLFRLLLLLTIISHR